MITTGEFVDVGSVVEANTIYVYKLVDGPLKGLVSVTTAPGRIIMTAACCYEVDIVPVAEYKRALDVEGIKIETPMIVYHARVRNEKV
jgi:hypothetical protein